MDNHSEKELWEEFTFKGFIVISLYAAMFFSFFKLLIALPIAYFFDIPFFENPLIAYSMSWIFCFLIGCLNPKLQARKEERKKNSKKRYKK